MSYFSSARGGGEIVPMQIITHFFTEKSTGSLNKFPYILNSNHLTSEKLSYKIANFMLHG